MGVGAFGDHEFGASESCIRIPNDFEFTESLNFEMQSRTGKKPATYVKGQGEMTFPMTIHLDARMLDTDLASEIGWWLKAMRKQTKGKLYLFGHYWGTNSFIVTSVHPANTKTAGKTMLSCDLEIKLTEWVAEGSAEKNSVSAAATDTKYSSGTTQHKSDIKGSGSEKKTKNASPGTEEQIAKASGKAVTIHVAATKKTGPLTVTAKGVRYGGGGGRGGGRNIYTGMVLYPSMVKTIQSGDAITVTWDSSKTYWVKIYTVSGEMRLAYGNKGKLGPIQITQNVAIEACWR